MVYLIFYYLLKSRVPWKHIHKDVEQVEVLKLELESIESYLTAAAHKKVLKKKGFLKSITTTTTTAQELKNIQKPQEEEELIFILKQKRRDILQILKHIKVSHSKYKHQFWFLPIVQNILIYLLIGVLFIISCISFTYCTS